MHLTDHLSGQISYSTSAEFTGDEVETNATYAAAQLALWKAGDPTRWVALQSNKRAQWSEPTTIHSLYNSPNNAVYYGNLTTLFGEAGATDLIADLTRTQPAQVAAYSSNAEVRAGYDATYTAEVRDIYPSPVGQCEILLAWVSLHDLKGAALTAKPTETLEPTVCPSDFIELNISLNLAVALGSYGVGVKTISIQAALQHPLSRGSVKVTSASVFDAPLIDPGYLTQYVIPRFEPWFCAHQYLQPCGRSGSPRSVQDGPPDWRDGTHVWHPVSRAHSRKSRLDRWWATPRFVVTRPLTICLRQRSGTPGSAVRCRREPFIVIFAFGSN
jgi:hypothetical protein